ncbi:hypothetical protein ABEF95_011289 [Exophiala dermatitidis]
MVTRVGARPAVAASSSHPHVWERFQVDHDAGVFNARKRPQPGACPVDNSPAHGSSKRIKRSPTDNLGKNPAEPHRDHLAAIRLTKCALEELDRRNTQVNKASLTPQEVPGRITSHGASRLTSSHDAYLPAAEFVASSRRSILEELRQFARLGGPDLSDIRGSHIPIPRLRSELSMSQPKPIPGGRERPSDPLPGKEVDEEEEEEVDVEELDDEDLDSEELDELEMMQRTTIIMLMAALVILYDL